MIPKPDKYPDWATNDYYDPINKSHNVVEPTDARKAIGFVACAQAANNEVNYQFRYINDWIKFLDVHRPDSYTVATVPSAADKGAGAMIYVSDETGGAVIAFSDGTNWRRVTDRTIIS